MSVLEMSILLVSVVEHKVGGSPAVRLAGARTAEITNTASSIRSIH